MNRILGSFLGGIKKKTVFLAVSILVLLGIGVSAISAYQNRMLISIVGETRIEQQQAISQTSKETMHQVIANTLVSSTALQAEVADNDFHEIVNDIYMLRTMAQELIERKDRLRPAELSLPDPSRDGIPSSLVLSEADVDYTESEYLPAVGHMSSSMLAMFNNSDKIDGCYIGLADGTHFGVDVNFSNKYDADGNLIPFPVRERPWYKGAVEAGGLFFTGIEKDAFSGTPGITCSLPVVVDDEIVGVVGIDIVLKSMCDFINTSSNTSGFSVIVNNNGQVIIAPESNEFFKITTSEEAIDLREVENKDLAECFINFMLSEEPAIANAEYTWYPSPNSLVYTNADYIEEIGEAAMEILYPGVDEFNSLYNEYAYRNLKPEMLDYVNTLWESLKIA